MLREEIAKIKGGDLEVLDKIYLETKAKFLSYARNNFSSITIEEAEDLYQDTIIDFYTNIQRGLLSEIHSSISAYIIQIGKIKLIKLSTEKKKVDWRSEKEIQDLISTDEYSHRIDEIVRYVFAITSENCKQILSLFYYERKTMDEIASILGYKNADSVKAKKFRCLTKITEIINKMHFTNE
jgi:RNA polymerase sigma-70 factor (ECF subfamily)